MVNQIKIRYGWLKGMYIYTILGAGLSGLGMILMPKTYSSMFNLPVQEPINFGILAAFILLLVLFQYWD